jgi:hypothetical protein
MPLLWTSVSNWGVKHTISYHVLYSTVLSCMMLGIHPTTYLSQQQLGVVQVQHRRGRGVDGQGCRDGNETE